MTEQALACDGERPLSLVPLRPYSTAVPALIYCALLANFLCCGKHFNNLNWNIKSLTWGCLQKASSWLGRQFFFYVMQKSKLLLVAWLFLHEVHSMIRLWKSSMLEHWKTLQVGWVNKTVIEFGFRMISWIIKTSCLYYLPQPSASADNSRPRFW